MYTAALNIMSGRLLFTAHPGLLPVRDCCCCFNENSVCIWVFFHRVDDLIFLLLLRPVVTKLLCFGCDPIRHASIANITTTQLYNILYHYTSVACPDRVRFLILKNINNLYTLYCYNNIYYVGLSDRIQKHCYVMSKSKYLPTCFLRYVQ